MNTVSARRTIARLHNIRCRFGAEFAAEKLRLLERLEHSQVRTAADAKRLHSCLCLIRAFPDSAAVLAKARSELANFHKRVQKLRAAQKSRLAESGIAGTVLHYPFSYEVACWIAHNFPGTASIDWRASPDTDRLDELVKHLLEHAETEYFHGGTVSTEEWLLLATREFRGTDFDWLMAQLAERRSHEQFWRALYDAIDLPLKCKLRNDRYSRTGNAMHVSEPSFRRDSMRNRIAFAKREIVQPLAALTLLDTAQGNRILDVARSSLALRHRETDHFNNANPGEIHLAEVGKGVSIALMGLLPERRDPLECTMGYLILSNGVPIGYGGASILFHQANTGINIFDEYRGSEAAWLWTQVMRVVHALIGCTRFIANPYQFGEDNTEALKSGAFWFYYRLGYRPVDPGIRKVAKQEFRRIRLRKEYRSPVKTLKQLATCDMHLLLPAARQSQLFSESWIERCGLLATSALAAARQPSRKEALDDVVAKVMRTLGVRTMEDWPAQQRAAFMRFCPLIAALDLASWPAIDRRSLLRLVRAKGGRLEIDYARRLKNHARFFEQLKSQCRNASIT